MKMFERSSVESSVAMSDEARLINTLMQRYEKIGTVARPMLNSSEPLKVRLSLMLYQLISVDESEQFITLKLWIHTVVLYNNIRKAKSPW